MSGDPWSRDASSGAPTEVCWTCPDCGHSGTINPPRPERPSPRPFVTMGVSIRPPVRPKWFETPAPRRFTPCWQCDVDNTLLQGLPEMERMAILRHVYRLGVISRRELIKEQIKLYMGALDEPAYLRLSENKVIVSAARVRTLRESLAALEEPPSQE